MTEEITNRSRVSMVASHSDVRRGRRSHRSDRYFISGGVARSYVLHSLCWRNVLVARAAQ